MPEENKESIDDVRLHEIFETPFEDRDVKSPIMKLAIVMGSFVDGPVTWFRENVMEWYRKDRPKLKYYHQKFKRVPTIDQCYTDDMACIYEADIQYKRDKRVDMQIVGILRHRYYNCIYYNRNVNEYFRNDDLCLKEKKEYKDAELNAFIKYGDLGAYHNVIDAFMKQKHRLIWERRQREGINIGSANYKDKPHNPYYNVNVNDNAK